MSRYAGYGPPTQLWQEATPKRRRSAFAPGGGSVRVRPTRLSSPSAEKRYQYQLSGARSETSTCTACALAGCATTSPVLDDAREAGVTRHLPAHRHGLVGHPATVQRRGRQPRPQHDRVERRGRPTRRRARRRPGPGRRPPPSSARRGGRSRQRPRRRRRPRSEIACGPCSCPTSGVGLRARLSRRVAGGWKRPSSGWSPPLELKWLATTKTGLPSQRTSPASGLREFANAVLAGSMRPGESDSRGPRRSPTTATGVGRDGGDHAGHVDDALAAQR